MYVLLDFVWDEVTQVPLWCGLPSPIEARPRNKGDEAEGLPILAKLGLYVKKRSLSCL